MAMTATTNTNCEVSTPSNRFINKIRKSIGWLWCKNHLKDAIIVATLNDCNMDLSKTCRRLTMIHDFQVATDLSSDEVFTILKEYTFFQVSSNFSSDLVVTILKECNMDLHETCRRLKTIHDVSEVASDFSVDEVYIMLKECSMDQSKTCRMLKMINAFRGVIVANRADDVYTMLTSEAIQRLLYKDTFQEVKKIKDTGKAESDANTVQEVEKKKDTGKADSDANTVQEVEKKKDTGKAASDANTVQEVEKKKDTGKAKSDGNTVQEVEKKKDTGKAKSDGNTVQEVEKKKNSGIIVSNSDTVQEDEKKRDTGKTVSNSDTVQEVEKKSNGDIVQEVETKKDNHSRGASRYSSKVNNDAGRRYLTSGVANNHVKRVWRPKSPVESGKESNVTHMAAISNTSQCHKLAPKESSVTVTKHTSASAINTHSASNQLKLPSQKLDVPKGTNVPPTKLVDTKRPAAPGANIRRWNNENSVRVSNLSEYTSEADLEELFSPFGKVSRVRIVMDHNTGMSRGFGFVNFNSREEGEIAIEELNRHGYDHRMLTVQWAAPRSFDATRSIKPSSRLDDRTAKSGRATYIEPKGSTDRAQ